MDTARFISKKLPVLIEGVSAGVISVDDAVQQITIEFGKVAALGIDRDSIHTLSMEKVPNVGK